MGTSIVAGGVEFDIGSKVVLWSDIGGLNAYPMGKFNKRNLTLQQLQPIIKNFVFHHSVTYTAKSTFGGLVARGLSCNFIIDDDGGVDASGKVIPATIYQTLDVKDGAYSQAPLNHVGAGVEISYMPLSVMKSVRTEDLYNDAACKRYGVEAHTLTSDEVHGTVFKCYGPSDGQMEALKALAWGYSELFPSIPTTFPRGKGGEFLKTTLSAPSLYEGFMCHYHLNRQKIDALGLDMKAVEDAVAERKVRGF